MKIGGLQKLTLIDYPGKLACTIFISGCNFRCPWCYSSELVVPEKIEELTGINKKEVFAFLEKRKGKIEGIVLCGGEPTVDPDVVQFVEEIKEKSFSVKLDTNGSRPEVIQELLEKGLLDYIAMDIKAPLERYQEVVGVAVDTNKIKESIEIIKNCGIDYEFRTTIIPGVHQKKDVEKMGKMIEGGERYFLQNFLPEKTIDEGFLERKPFIQKDLEILRKAAEPFVKECKTRG